MTDCSVKDVNDKKYGLDYKGVNNAPLQITSGFLPRCPPLCSSFPYFKAQRDSKHEAAFPTSAIQIYAASLFRKFAGNPSLLFTAVSKFNNVSAGDTVKSFFFLWLG
jgi:hypothetical protein